MSVVIPVFNSEGTLRLLMERLTHVLAETAASYEIVMVDDGSRDRSWEVIEELRQDHPCLVGIQLMRNFGQHNATMCGLRHTSGELIITLDDDLQHPPEEIPKLLAAIQDPKLDLVYGNYHGSKHHGWLRNFGSRILQATYRTLFDSRVHPTSFRIIRRVLVESIDFYALNYIALDGLLAWNSERLGEVAVEHHNSGQMQSRYSAGKLASTTVTMVSNFTIGPLRVVSLLGLLTSSIGLSFGAYYTLLQITDFMEVPGYASTIVAIFVLGGIQLLALGVIGEYLGRIHMNINRKPQYVERHVLERASTEPDATRESPPS